MHQTKFRADTVDADIVDPERGNCMQAAFASVFELELHEVPHFASFADDWWQQVEAWCAARNITPMYFQAGEFTNNLVHLQLDTYYLVDGKSPRGDFSHVVVYRGLEMVHDPHPSGAGLDGNPRGVYYFVVRDPAQRD